MHTEIEIIARRGRSPRVMAVGGLAVRQTGVDTVHLISTAATPLGGDVIDIRVVVEPDASLHLKTVAATLALPARQRPDSQMTWDIEVGAGGRLHLDPQPTVVAGGADHRTTTTVAADPSATLIIAEHAQLGRSTERVEDVERARWQGGLRVDVGESPLLRHRLGLGGPTGSGHCAVSSVFRYPDARESAVSEVAYAARLELARTDQSAPATLTTALGSSAHHTRVLADDLDLAALRTG
ncbi:urease accessory protein UreD [Gordonia sp. HNM0687]|uniref:Urease accessory protein UreD n=1 Tax=Gordonia mangrovi TaxID=2665643 RepID=A0A6L7GVR6_9ACTN|nr:urease accessory protein UreD [Gordonia mangrovi]MXP24079.1 urease accessory protein UreD [Gordonia mangrovi]UVF78116.1 urease accessory protein UreD [Gordonia mangrovi]